MFINCALPHFVCLTSVCAKVHRQKHVTNARTRNLKIVKMPISGVNYTTSRLHNIHSSKQMKNPNLIHSDQQMVTQNGKKKKCQRQSMQIVIIYTHFVLIRMICFS
jgi:hypothetical protein